VSKTSFLEQLEKEIEYLQDLFDCTRAEAFFVLRIMSEKWDPTDNSMWIDSGTMKKSEFNDPRSWAFYIAAETMDLLDSFKAEALNAHPNSERRGGTDPIFAMYAVQICGRLGFPVPKWADEMLWKTISAYERHEVATLDEAFKVKRPRHYRQEKEREALEKSHKIYFDCLKLQDEGVKIGDSRKGEGLFEIVGKRYNMSAGKVREYYYKRHRENRAVQDLIRRRLLPELESSALTKPSKE
jgi:hypothetical protein